jgi:prevent-host-death family protein
VGIEDRHRTVQAKRRSAARCATWSPRDHKPIVWYTVATTGKGRRCCWRCTMELSVREAKARFAEAAAAAARGERVVVTKHGRPFVELVSAQGAFGMDFEKAAKIRQELGLDGLKVSLPPDFDDPAFSRLVLGLKR